MRVKVISLPYIFQVFYVLCFTRPRYQVSVYRTIGPLVYIDREVLHGIPIFDDNGNKLGESKVAARSAITQVVFSRRISNSCFRAYLSRDVRKQVFWEIAARWVSNLFSLYFVYLLYLFISRFGFKSGICLLIAPVPVHCFSITFIFMDSDQV